jgi:hypothetical protein
MTERITKSDVIHFNVTHGAKTFEVAHFEDGGNGMDGHVTEGDNARLSAGDLCALAAWILTKAEERANRLEET